MNPEEKLYTNELTFLCYGLPIWEPDPMGLYDHVRIGDVGYIEDGKFIPLFNILPPHPESNPDDRFLIARPDFWQPLLLPSNPDPNIPTRFTHNTNPLSPRVYARESALTFSTSMAANSAGSVGIGEFSLSFTKERGAALVLPSEARREDTLYKEMFAKHMLDNYRQWERFMVDRYKALSDLILVTGCDMTRRWAMATYNRSSREITATLGTQVPGIVEAKFSLTAGWRTADAVDTRQGPPEEQPANNQCIFLRGFYLKRRLGIFAPKVLKAGAGYHDPGNHGPEEEGVGMLADDDVTVESLTLSINRDNLITVLLDYMLEESNADVVITHDSDLWPYLGELKNPEDLCETLKRKRPSIKVEDGVGSLDAHQDELYSIETAIDFMPLNSADRPGRLNNLGNSYQNRFQRFGEAKDIDLAIKHQREAVASTPLDNADLPGFLTNLGLSHMHRFGRFGEVKDIESAIERQLAAVASTPLDSPDRPERLNNLGNSYQSRFQRFGETKDIDLAIEQLCEAVASDSADQPRLLCNLGDSYQSRFESIQQLTDLDKSLSNFRLSSISPTGLLSSRIRGSLKWARLAHQVNNLGSASEAYDQAIRLLPQVARFGLSAVVELDDLNSDIQTLGCDAAACMISLAQADSCDEQRHLGRAIELLDQGRSSILWPQTSIFKPDLEDLREVHSQLACELDLAGKVLGQGCCSSDDTRSETDAQLYRRSAEKWEELVCSIRTLPGFDHFLLPPSISTLRTAAVDGPVVIINSSKHRCDAIIIPPQTDLDLVLVPLPNVTMAKLNTLTKSQPEKFASRKWKIGTALYDSNEPPRTMTLESVLNQTWLLVGEPIIQKFKELGLLGSRMSTTRRVWWCLTGSFSFLPIHASFPPTEPSRGMMDLVISSYTPTISALLRAQQHRKLSTFRMLAVGQASDTTPLPGVTEEIAFISKKLGAEAETLQEYKATVDEVAAALSTCSWAHFACHAVQDPDKPMDSGLVLWNDHRLTLSRLAQSSLGSAEFAFLSCCHSATGSKQSPNEAVHLAAGLQFIGFRGVIGTMGCVRDNDALSIVMQVYEELFKDGTAQASPSNAALALHQAVCHLRKHVPLVQWVPFVHFGL